jgi:hypothetical protein
MKRIFENILDTVRGFLWKITPKYKGRSIFSQEYWDLWKERRKKGYDLTDTWSLDYTFTKFIAPRLNDFAYTYDLGRMSVPNSILDEEQKASIAKGYEWDTRRWQLADKKERRRCWNRAIKRWTNILHEMADGYNDLLLEEDDWDTWNKKWEAVASKWNKKIDKAKTIKEKEKIWNQIGTWREYNVNVRVSASDVTWAMRERAMDLFRKYYHALWW